MHEKIQVFIDGVEMKFTHGFNTLTGECTVVDIDAKGNIVGLDESGKLRTHVVKGRIDVIALWDGGS